jgi:predicted RNA-binding protein with PIN domain
VQTKLRTDKVADTVTPFVSRIAEDEELRAHAKTALDSARVIYQRIQSDGARRAAARRDVQDEVVKAAAELRQTARRLSEQPKRKSHKLRKLILTSAIVIGAVAAAKQLLSHDEDEFDYEP